MKLVVTDPLNPYVPGCNRARLHDLVVAMEGCTREQVARAVSDVCSSNGWSNETPSRPVDRLVAEGQAHWE
jgi:hypothetical protein